MALQFQRIYEVQVGGLMLRNLDLRFVVSRSLEKEPNTAELFLFNLNEDNRGTIEAAGTDQTVQIKAGYQGLDRNPNSALAAVDEALGTGGGETGKPSVIFLGDVREAQNNYDPPTWTTVIEAGDGEKAIRTSRINKSFAPGTSVAAVVNELARSMTLGIGNAARKALSAGNLFEAGREFVNGVTVSGQAYKELAALVRSTGQELSIQDGVIQILGRGETLTDLSVALSTTSGLLGSPTIGDKGIIKFVALLNPDLVPGRQVELSTRTVNGRFRIERVEFRGETAGADWTASVEASEL